MHARRHGAPGLFELDRIQRKPGRQAEQAEMVVCRQDYTVNDSPQPQVAFSLGLLNLNPSFRPSRA
ncbi:Uncharacterised protein [Bordetella pertussis]|nr:Uncharacterised protein [Bordetella pertussis]CFP64540.1 Uncharacterised protein [Bordetella pertussis]CFT89239.1 Uncharacterised protein [Bordetella pertussis]CFW29076.1 Uncharacterised protein [Bordetella pertussis]CPN72221.1 Uncharacterised protein [Bordetella pertussis]